MGAENFANQGAEGKRSAKRARVLLAAKLKDGHFEIDARLRDLSSKGALVECIEVPKVGTEVLFVRGRLSVPARVAWAGTDRVGLEFHREIDEHDVFVHLGKAGAAKPQNFLSPGVAPRWTSDERKTAQIWGIAVGLNIPESDG